MYEDAVFFTIGGVRIYAYGAFVAAGSLAAGALLLYLSRGDGRKRTASALTCLFATPLGLLFSRLLYCAGDASFREVASLKSVMDLSSGGYSMYGAFLGFTLAALASSALVRLNRRAFLDLLAPSIMAFVFFARLGEGFTALGISRPLVTGMLKESFLAFRDEYDAYLKTFLLEAAAASLLCMALLHQLRRHRRPGDVFFSWMLYYGAAQTLFESLRYDYHMRLSFIGIQHILSAVLLALALLVFAGRLLWHRNSQALALLSLGLLPLLFPALIGLEFMIDRSSLNKGILYAAYALLLLIPVVLGITMRERGDRLGP